MQDPEKLREIDSLGQEEDEGQEEYWEEPERQPGWNSAPLLQAVICALALAALLILKFADEEKYQGIAGWYANEMAQEIELPYFERATPQPDPTPAPTVEPSPTPLPPQLGSSPLEML